MDAWSEFESMMRKFRTRELGDRTKAELNQINAYGAIRNIPYSKLFTYATRFVELGHTEWLSFINRD